MAEAARFGDIDTMLELIAQIEHEHPQFAHNLKTLTEDFQFEEIIHAIHRSPG